MHFTTLTLASLAAGPALAETLYSVVVFTRHGDRTAKYFKGYGMTNLGATQMYESGQYYRERYVDEGASNKILNISSDKAVTSQIWASAPDQGILYQTATDFLQGLYPPLNELNTQLSTETLTNGTEVMSPLNGYQFILIHGEDTTTPDTIWIKGDDQCPTYDTAYDTYHDSVEYQETLNATGSFYQKFIPLLGDIMGPENVSYVHAYDVFDLLNVGSIHNESVAENLEAADLDRLRYLANHWEWNHNYNQTMPDRSIGGMTLAGGALRQLQEVVKGKAKIKFNLMAGSYDTQMAFYGLTNLTAASPDFFGLPNYAGSMAFEVFSEEDNATAFPANPDKDLRVRFLFKNGTTDDELTPFPLFGGSELSLPYGEFVSELSSRSIVEVNEWCTLCQSDAGFCYEALHGSDDSSSGSTAPSTTASSGGSGLSNAAAGGIGAGVTLGVVGIIGALAWLLTRRKRTARVAPAPVSPPAQQVEKKSSSSQSDVSV
jgi:prostatic aicd phosphatase